MHVLFDSDTNNELDDQHALAYLLFNGGTFELAGVTVNATRKGGGIGGQYAEAERVMKLCGFENNPPIYKGTNNSFDAIQHQLDSATFDGHEAVNFIIKQSKKATDGKLIVIGVGKLTNLALALKKDPSIADRIRLVWLGSNYPDPGEYNLENDTASVNYVIGTNVEFEMVTVRYGKPSGTDVVKITQEAVNRDMPGKGPTISTPVTGRDGGSFTTFGDYSIDLFKHTDYHGVPPSRALFDMAAVAIVKNPSWAKKMQIPGPRLVNGLWIDQPGNTRIVSVWENFDKEKILADFYESMENYQLVDIVRD